LIVVEPTVGGAAIAIVDIIAVVTTFSRFNNTVAAHVPRLAFTGPVRAFVAQLALALRAVATRLPILKLALGRAAVAG